jgi:hypothetical protein
MSDGATSVNGNHQSRSRRQNGTSNSKASSNRSSNSTKNTKAATNKSTKATSSNDSKTVSSSSASNASSSSRDPSSSLTVTSVTSSTTTTTPSEEQLRREYNQWKAHVPVLYDLMIAYALEWPSYTAQWVPTPSLPVEDEPGYFLHRVCHLKCLSINRFNSRTVRLMAH